jgi:DNA-binding CsgD family transcriptional regulator/N-acetylneuraminic acid mutarotase
MPDSETNAQLSERELEILKMVATGASNQQIAHQLVISVNTVKVHLRNVFEKLGVQSRTEATTLAIQKGWVVVAENGNAPSEVAAPPPRKTFLLPANTQPTLRPWQQLYLFGATLLAALVLVIPLLPRRVVIEKPNLPVIFAQPPTPMPPTPANPDNQRWARQASLPSKRAGLGLVAFEGRLYAIGGVKDNNEATRSVDIYDPATNRWTEGSNKPTATSNITGVLVDDKIYVPGGCTNLGEAVKTLEIYDPQDDSWRKGQALPQARCGYGLAALKGKLYLFGGWDGGHFVDTVLVYTVKTDQWETSKSRLPQPMGYMGAAVLNDQIYVAGGYDGRSEFNQTYTLDPATGQWQPKAAMQEKRGGLGLVGAANTLYAVGGGWNEPSATSEKYDPNTDTWTPFETPFTEPWRNLGLTTIDTRIYAVGGWNDDAQKYMDTVVSYQFLFQLFLPVSVEGDK